VGVNICAREALFTVPGKTKSAVGTNQSRPAVQIEAVVESIQIHLKTFCFRKERVLRYFDFF
jgi:hypothetical protein